MPFVTPRRQDHEEEGDAVGLSIDLEERACSQCRRPLHPWQDRCPDDGAPAVLRSNLPPPLAAPPAHLLEDDD